MLREPRKSEQSVQAPKDQKGRFQVVKLEARIAPASKHLNGGGNCHYSDSAGKYVGCGS